MGSWRVSGGKKCGGEGKVVGILGVMRTLWWEEGLGCLRGVGGGGVGAWKCVEVDVEVGDVGCVGFVFDWW